MNTLFEKLTDYKFKYFLIVFFFLLIPTFFLKKEFLNLQLNSLHNPSLDFFFKYITYLGDGLIYIPIIIVCFFIKIKHSISFIVLFLIQSSFSLLFKNIIFPDSERPLLYLKDTFHLLHKVKGEIIHNYGTFPSGHTMTAFAIIFLALYNFSFSKKLTLLLLLISSLVAISRVYLLQHFYIDIVFGYFFGYISALLTHIFVENNKKLKKYYA